MLWNSSFRKTDNCNQGSIAQLVERLPSKQKVECSNPSGACSVLSLYFTFIHCVLEVFFFICSN